MRTECARSEGVSGVQSEKRMPIQNLRKKNEMDNTSRLGTDNITRLLISLAIPAIVAQLVSILYNTVDRIFVGRIADGTTAMAALSVSLPIVTLITAFTRLVGIGGAPLCAIRLGQKDQDGAEEILGNSFSALILTGAIITAVILLFHEQLLLLFGADVSTLSMGSEYITIYSLGTIFVMISLGMNSYITTQGFAKIGMFTVLIGAVLNIGLDALFIFGFDWGIQGAAWATVLSQGVSAAWAMQFLLSKKSTVKIKRRYLLPKARVIIPIMALGVSPFTMSATESLVQISFNNQLAIYGGTMAVGAIAILYSLWQFVTLPLQGFCQGAQPIISYNYGAKNFARVREAFKLNLRICIFFSAVITLAIIVFSRFMAGIFSANADMIRLCSWAMRLYIVGGITFGAQVCCQQSFMALGQAKISLVMAMLRKVILLVPLIYILPALFRETAFASGMAASVADLIRHPGAVTTILMSEPLSDILAAAATSWVFYRFYKKNLCPDLSPVKE